MAHYVYLVRHGEQQDAEYGLPDGPLSPRGKRQAHLIAERLGGVPFTGAWHSPLQRAAETAAIIAERLQSYSEADKSYSYTIVSGPIPVKNYRSTLRVTGEPGANECVAEWSSEFDAAEGVEEVMVGAFQHLYETAFVDLKRIMAI